MDAVSAPGLPLSYVNARTFFRRTARCMLIVLSVDIGKRSRGAAIGLLFYDHGMCSLPLLCRSRRTETFITSTLF